VNGASIVTSCFTVPSAPDGDATGTVWTPIPNVASVDTSRKPPAVESGSRVQKIAAASVASPAATPSVKADASARGYARSMARSTTAAPASVTHRMRRSRTGRLLLFVFPSRSNVTSL
jgi:hypothetical protein